jgi:hypothetical protein
MFLSPLMYRICFQVLVALLQYVQDEPTLRCQASPSLSEGLSQTMPWLFHRSTSSSYHLVYCEAFSISAIISLLCLLASGARRLRVLFYPLGVIPATYDSKIERGAVFGSTFYCAGISRTRAPRCFLGKGPEGGRHGVYFCCVPFTGWIWRVHKPASWTCYGSRARAAPLRSASLFRVSS